MSGLARIDTGEAGRINKYISDRGRLDRVMSVVQFASQTLTDPVLAAGYPALSANLKTVVDTVSQYRAITRASQWFVVTPILNPKNMAVFLTKSASTAIGLTRIISTALFTLFLIGEELNLLTKLGILHLPALTARTNRIRVVFLFYSNVVRTIMNYLLLKDFKADKAKTEKAKTDKDVEREYKKLLYAVWDGVLMTMYTYTMQKRALPAGPRNWGKALATGDVVEIITSFAPPVYPIPNTPSGIMGLIASVPGFLSTFA